MPLGIKVRHGDIMLDIKFLRDNLATIRQRIQRKGFTNDHLEALLAADERVRSLKTDTERLRAEQNNKSKLFGEYKKAGKDVGPLNQELAALKAQSQEAGERLAAEEAALQTMLDLVPNLVHESVPAGKDPSDNKIVKTWGEPAKISGAKPHWDIGPRHGMWLERGAAMSGAGFPLLVGPVARLERALIQFFLDTHTTKNGYTEVNPPFAVRRDALYGTGYLPKLEGEQYHAERDGLYLVPTAEVPLTAIHAGEILQESELPRKYCAYTPCFRREAGAAGADTRGMIRVHQFSKVEIMQLAHPSKSYEAHESLTRNAEELLEALEMPYRRLLLCTEDQGFSAAKCYDLEIYSAGVDRWLEISSCSNFEAFQARRSRIRYKDSVTGKNEFCHTLNGSGLALPRLLIALVENGQQPDGSVRLPKVIHKYYGKETL